MAYPMLIAAIAIQTTRSPQNPVVPAAIPLIGMPRAIEPSATTGSMLSCFDASAGRTDACASLASTRASISLPIRSTKDSTTASRYSGASS
jgi:hypothetical protein